MKEHMLVINPCPNRIRTLEVLKNELGLYISVAANDIPNNMLHLIDNFIKVDTLDHSALVNALIPFHNKEPFNAVMSDRELFIESTSIVATKLNLRYNSISTIASVRNKYKTGLILNNARVKIPKFRKINSIDDLFEAVKYIGFPFILKPIGAASSEGVFKICEESDIKVTFERILRITDPRNSIVFRYCPREFIAEEFMVGKEYSVEGVASNGELFFAGITAKISTPDQFLEIQQCFPAKLELNESDEILNITHKALHAVGWKHGGFHVEVMLTLDGVKIVEINGRLAGGYITTHLIPLATGINIVKANALSLLGKVIEFSKTLDRVACTRFFVTNKVGKIKQWVGLEKVQNMDGIVDVMLEAKIGDVIQMIPNRQVLSRIAAVISIGNTQDEAVANANLAIAHLDVIVEN